MGTAFLGRVGNDLDKSAHRPKEKLLMLWRRSASLWHDSGMSSGLVEVGVNVDPRLAPIPIDMVLPADCPKVALAEGELENDLEPGLLG